MNPVCISYCCQGTLITAGNFIWRYCEEPLGKIRLNYSRNPVTQYGRNGKFISEYDSIKSASDITNICLASISKCCRGERSVAGNFMWRYKTTS